MGGCQTMMLTWPRNLTSSDYISHDTPVMLSGNLVHSALCSHSDWVITLGWWGHVMTHRQVAHVFLLSKSHWCIKYICSVFFWIIYNPGPDYIGCTCAQKSVRQNISIGRTSVPEVHQLKTIEVNATSCCHVNWMKKSMYCNHSC